MHKILLILGVACLIAALVLVLKPKWVAAVPAFIGLVLMHLSYYIAVPGMTFAFWGIATLITIGLFYLSPSGEPDGHSSSNLYVGLTAMAGGMLGAAFNNLGSMVLGDNPTWQWPFFLLIVIIGHALNFAMSCLGAFVHPLRLTFVEYFKNSGYEGKGQEYVPLSNQIENK